MPVLIGTSGWQYRDWRGTFYPGDLPQANWLEYYAERFQTQEVNNAFYRLPEASTFTAWAERAPDDFVMVVKASRFLTHIKRLKDPEEPVQRFVERASCLGSKLGPVLLQLPPTMKADNERLDAALSLFPSDWRLAVEFRHETWHTAETCDVLRSHGAAWCMADSTKRTVPAWTTAEWGYLRFHDGTGTPRPCYTKGRLDRWVGTLAELFPPEADVFVFFNNDPRGCAVYDARVFAALCAKHGLEPTRVPGEKISVVR
ncbi:MAG TPA: DUF72 domain-containing protein [Acidimicrobiales bacterium]|nr:DUF72 domain-containing protein [Acidimicrobiales bacterium]